MKRNIIKLWIKCKYHGAQLATPVMGGEVWCAQCQKEYIKKIPKEI